MVKRVAPTAKHGRTKGAAAVKRALFCSAYLANGRKPKQAAISAGYPAKSAANTAYKLLREPRVMEIVKAKTEVAIAKFDMTAESVLRELAAIVHFDPRKLLNEDGTPKALSELDDATAAAIQGIDIYIEKSKHEDGSEVTESAQTVKYKVADKNSAIQKAMLYFNLLKEGNININAGKVYCSSEELKLG
jgi:phage terminase small subunit